MVGFAEGEDAELGCAGFERGARDGDGSVSVAVGFDDGGDCGGAGGAAEDGDVGADCGEVDFRPAAAVGGVRAHGRSEPPRCRNRR